jgi:glutamate--cysteine ligase
VSSEQYFALIRNFRRHAFVLLYLFGASPALCPALWKGAAPLQRLGDQRAVPAARHLAAHGPPGLPERRAGHAGRELQRPQGYANSLHEALTKPYPAYEAVGIRNPGGDYNQLGTSLLQIENEFYGTIRPKRVRSPASARCTRCASAGSNMSKCA